MAISKKKIVLILLFFKIAIVVFCIFFNSAKIYEKMGIYYYNKNNIAKSQIYCEKAFENGVVDKNLREIYVNSIINSPFDIEAQKKLIKFLSINVEDIAQLKAKYFIEDIRAEILRKYPENYIANTVYNQKVVRWADLPIRYAFVKEADVPDYFIEEFENAFIQWEKATEHQIFFECDEENPNIIIKFSNNNFVGKQDEKYVVAYTYPEIIQEKLKSMEIRFYVKDLQGKNFSMNQVYNTALHEIAHALGFMGHSSDSDNIMYLTKDAKLFNDDIRELLTKADISTIKLLYKIKPDITNSDNAKGEYLPYLILGDKNEIISAKKLEAKTYINNAPNIPAGYIDLAETHVQSKNYPKAIKCLEKALLVSDTEEMKAMVHYNLAVTYFYIDNILLSKDNLIKSIQFEESEEKLNLLCEIYLREGNIKSAIVGYEDLIKKNPNNIEYVIALTNIHVLNHKYLKARRVLKGYISSNPRSKNLDRLKSYGILLLGL